MSNESDNSNFVFSPQIVNDNSPQDLNKIAGNITALYTITAPQQGGYYRITLFAQGTFISTWIYVTKTVPVPEFYYPTLTLTVSAFATTMVLMLIRSKVFKNRLKKRLLTQNA
jgi:hypothetical protein